MNIADSNKTTNTAFGGGETRYFYELTPDVILTAVESLGLKVTGRCNALNSFENRVYEVEVELEEDDSTSKASASDRFRVIKFYRPGRWTEEQILEEHRFLFELVELDIPVVAPLRFSDGSSLKKLADVDIFSAIFPRRGGRSIPELDTLQLKMAGRLLARLHQVGSVSEAPSRLMLHPTTYGDQSLEYLLTTKSIPAHLESQYVEIVDEISDISEPWFEEVSYQRIHGDFHIGNILWRDEGPLCVDFDDMLTGPCVQDIWLLLPGRDEHAKKQLEILLSAYEEMRDFDRSSLRLIEPLRTLRMVHFDAWIAKRWSDPAFPKAFSEFGTERYWGEQIRLLDAQLQVISEI